MADLSKKTQCGPKYWNGIFKVLKENNLTRILCPVKISFKTGETNSLSD